MRCNINIIKSSFYIVVIGGYFCGFQPGLCNGRMANYKIIGDVCGIYKFKSRMKNSKGSKTVIETVTEDKLESTPLTCFSTTQ